MKKSVILLAVGLFLASTWGGITYVVGNKAQDYYHNLLADASQFGFVTFTNTSYERGFLQSKATTLMQIVLPAVPPEVKDETEGEPNGQPEAETTERTFQLEFDHIIYHGPLPSSSGPASRFGSGPAVALVETTLTRFAPDQEGLENLLVVIPDLKDTVSIARIDFDGTINSLLEIPAFEYMLEEGKISSGGLKAETVYSLVSGATSGTYNMQSIAFNSPAEGAMAWQGLSGEFNLQKALPMLYVGLNKALVGGIVMSFPTLESGEPEVVTIEGIESTSNSSFDGKMVQIEQNSTFGGIDIEGEKYGPMIIDAEVKNLDAQALSDFQQQLISLYKEADTLDPDTITDMILPTYLDLFGKLLAGDPEMNLRNFSLVTPKGNATGNVNLKFTGIEENSFDNPSMLLQYIQNIDMTANLSVDESLVSAIMRQQAKSGINEEIAVAKLLEQNLDLSDDQIEAMAMQQYEQQLEMMLAQNFIVRDGEKLTTSMTFKQGKLMVNGQSMPFLGMD